MKLAAFGAILLSVLALSGVPALAVAGVTAAPAVQAAADIPAGEVTLGTIHIGRKVKADGKPLPAGEYMVRLTAQTAQPAARGASEGLERWVEFVQGGQVKGREVVSIIPSTEVKGVAKLNPPPRGESRVELLKGNDYLRVWFNRRGTQFLIHLPVA
jgi:hypothetical protein